MSQYIEIHWTSASVEEARHISRYLVQERFVACAQIIPWVESIYMWDNNLHTAQESKIVLKAKKSQFDEIKNVIEQNCKYEVPEITYSEIVDGNESYLNWIKESTIDH